MSDPLSNASDRLGPSVVWPAVWRARWSILLVVLVVGVAGFVLSGLRDTEYTASSTVVLDQAARFDPLNDSSSSDGTRFVANQVSVFTSTPVLEAAADDLADGTDEDELASDVDVAVVDGSDVLQVSASAPTADEAADRANAVVRAYREQRAQEVSTIADRAVVATTDLVVADHIRTEAAAYGDGVSLVDTAAAPSEPSGPHQVRDGVLLAVIAALIAVGVAVVRRRPSIEHVRAPRKAEAPAAPETASRVAPIEPDPVPRPAEVAPSRPSELTTQSGGPHSAYRG